MSRIIECWRCDGTGYVEAYFYCAYCGGCGTLVQSDEEPDANLDDYIDEDDEALYVKTWGII